MSTYHATCKLCGHRQEVHSYSGYECEKCLQEYVYEEGHMLDLSPIQIEKLAASDRRCHTCINRRRDSDGDWVCINTKKIGERFDTGGKDDTLTYSYDEAGWFTPGPMFGCIHHEVMDDTRGKP